MIYDRFHLMSTILILLCTCCFAMAADKSAIAISYVRFTPTAVFSNGSDASVFSVRVSGPVKRVFILPDRISGDNSSPIKLAVDGKLTESVELLDNGSHGDQQAGDRIFTRANVRATDGTTALVLTTIRIVDTDGVQHQFLSSDYGGGTAPAFYLVAPKYRQKVTTSGDWRYTKRVANLRTSTLITLTDSTATSIDPDINKVREAYLNRFPDEQEFILVYLTQPCRISYFYFVHYRNEVQGIGVSIFETAGSHKLRGMLLTQNAPGALLHEMMHDWGVFLANAEFADFRPHWGAVNIPGLLWGMDFVASGGGAYTVTVPYAYGVYAKKPVKYAPMELYLMGVLPADQVPPVTVLEGITPTAYAMGATMTPSAVKTVNMNDIIAVNGVRSPGVATSQKKFRVTAVLLTYKSFASDAEMAVFSLFQKNIALKKPYKDENFGRSFRAATGGRAALVTKLPKAKPSPAPAGAVHYGTGRKIICPECMTGGAAPVIRRKDRS